MSLEEEEFKRLSDCVSKQFDLLKNPRTDFRVEEHFDIIGKFGRNLWMSIRLDQWLRLNVVWQIDVFMSRPFDPQ